MKKIYLFSLILLCFCSSAFAEENNIHIENGKKIFYKRCALCHFADKDQNRIGPTLHNIMGRPAALIPNYSYSTAMVKAGKNGLVWTKEKFEEYLHNPHKMIQGTKMAVLFMNNQQELDDLVAYLSSIPK